MPALGLLLEYPIFQSYNSQQVEKNQNLEPSHADYRPAIDWTTYESTMATFKQTFIYDNMRRVEDRKGMHVYEFILGKSLTAPQI